MIVTYSLTAFILDFQRSYWLLIVELLIGSLLVFQWVTDHYCPQQKSNLHTALMYWIDEQGNTKLAALVIGLLSIIMIGIMTTDPKNLMSVVGMLVFVLLSWLASYDPWQVNWRPVISGLFLQMLVGAMILKVPICTRAFAWLGQQVAILLNYTTAGSTFVYGYLADPGMADTDFVVNNNNEAAASSALFHLNPPFYFSILSFSALVSVLSYLGCVGYAVKLVGVNLAIVMGTTGPESFNCIANMFLDMTMSPLLIKPMLQEGVTDSELHAIMTAGFASVAGAVLAAYINFGASPSDLLAATIMSAPAALAISKIVYPETHKQFPTQQQRQQSCDEKDNADTGTGTGTRTTTSQQKRPQKLTRIESLFAIQIPKSEDPDIISAASTGVSIAVNIVLQIGGQLIAMLALVAMINGFLNGIGALIDIPTLSLQLITSYVFYPFAYLMGVSVDDCLQVGELIGTKVIINEFAAFAELQIMIENGTISVRSKTIATYALCGFSNLGSIAVTVGILSTLMPRSKKGNILRLVVSAMISGNTVCFMTACVASLFYTPPNE